jgi:hypothetical protein
VGLRAAWVLPDGTRVAVKPVTGEEWSVRVDEVEVPNEVARVSRFIDFDIRFRLPSGQSAVAVLRHPAGLSTWELRVGERSILYSGRRPFACPTCRKAVEAYATTCAGCGAEQPSNDVRLAERLRRAIVQSIASANLFFVVVGVARILSFRGGSSAALANLRRAEIDAHFPSQFDTSTAAGFHAGAAALLQSELVELATLMLVVFGIALLAYRAPLVAATLLCVFTAYMLLYAIHSGVELNAIAWLFYAGLAWGASRTLRAALDLRAGRYSMTLSHG